MTENTTLHSGYAAIVGRPNVGKSTLLNRMLGQKISITSRKPQTTRHRIMGIETAEHCQTVFVDTPGIQKKHDTAIHRYMNRAASSAVNDVDVIVFVIDRLSWTSEDEYVLESIQDAAVPVILVINKVDRIVDKNKLLPHIQSLSSRLKWADVVPVSAKVGNNIELLQKAIRKRLPQQDYLYDEEQITDRSERFLAAELIREKIMRQMGDELPHKVAVEIESYKEEANLIRINALIWVERDGQKKIIIGKAGERIKQIGSEARKDIEQLIARKVMLTLWVKVKGSWSDDDRMLKSLGYADQ